MLFVHSFSDIEKKLADQLSWYQPITEVNAVSFAVECELSSLTSTVESKVMIYSFQSLGCFTHIESFKRIYQLASQFASFAIANGFQRIVFISYPGAYFNALNLFLKLQGELEQLFTGTGIPCTILSVEAIYEKQSNLNSLHDLFYSGSYGAYVIPMRSGRIVHAVDLNYLLQLIMKAVIDKRSGKYDVFDSVFNLPDFLSEFSTGIPVKRFIPLHLYLLSFIGKYCSPSMFELFLTNNIPMFKYRAESDFALSLDEYQPAVQHIRSMGKRPRNLIPYAGLKTLIPIK